MTVAGGTHSAFSVTVLGTDGSYPGPGGACSGYLVRAGGYSTLLDAGSGILANLQLHEPLAELGAVVLSHAHPDHWSDLDGLYVALRYYVKRQAVPVYAPEGLRELLRIDKRDGTFDWHVIADGDHAEIGPLRWSWSVTDHPVETLAARAELDGKALGYSADTGPGWKLSQLGEGLDLALVEATIDAAEEGTLQHLSGRQAGETAACAGVKKLVLTHFAPPTDREKARRQAVAAFGGPVEVAEVGRTWQI